MREGLRMRHWHVGTGMVASFVRLHIEGLIGDTIRTIPKSGDELYISFEDVDIDCGGKVTKVFMAEIV